VPSISDSYYLTIGDRLAVSFQRYPEGVLRGATELPRSYGAAPIELSSLTRAFLPAREGEGIWLGLSPRTPCGLAVQVSWLSVGADLPRPWSNIVSKLEFLHGLIRPTGTFCPFVRFPLDPDHILCPGVVISVENRKTIQVQFVSVAEYEAISGKRAPRPISPDDCYGDWPLP